MATIYHESRHIHWLDIKKFLTIFDKQIEERGFCIIFWLVCYHLLPSTWPSRQQGHRDSQHAQLPYCSNIDSLLRYSHVAALLIRLRGEQDATHKLANKSKDDYDNVFQQKLNLQRMLILCASELSIDRVTHRATLQNRANTEENCGYWSNNTFAALASYSRPTTQKLLEA